MADNTALIAIMGKPRFCLEAVNSACFVSRSHAGYKDPSLTKSNALRLVRLPRGLVVLL